MYLAILNQAISSRSLDITSSLTTLLDPHVLIYIQALIFQHFLHTLIHVSTSSPMMNIHSFFYTLVYIYFLPLSQICYQCFLPFLPFLYFYCLSIVCLFFLYPCCDKDTLVSTPLLIHSLISFSNLLPLFNSIPSFSFFTLYIYVMPFLPLLLLREMLHRFYTLVNIFFFRFFFRVS